MSRPATFAILLVALVTGCTSVDEDASTICLGGNEGTEVDLEGDAPLLVNSTMAYGCSEVVEHTCTATLDGNVIQVSTSVGFQDGPRTNCETALLFSNASCETPRLAEGTYTVRYADQEQTLDVPSSGEVTCIPGL